MSKILGIIGGMGPIATADLYRKIISLTDAGCDQEHLRIIIDSHAQIPDRTNFILGKGEDPTPYLIESAQKLEMAGADCLIMPCNTAHYFYDSVKQKVKIPFLNMIEETALEVVNEFNYVKRVGLLATEGTNKTGIYETVFDKYNIEVVKPDNISQQLLSELIYNIKKGIFEFDTSGLREAINKMKSSHVDIFILGCTEMPVVFELSDIKENKIDSATVIAKRAIEFLGGKLKDQLTF